MTASALRRCAFGFALFTAGLRGTALPAAPASPRAERFPFEIFVAPADEAAFARGPLPGAPAGTGVPIEVRWKPLPGEQRLDVLQRRRDRYPGWQWVGSAPGAGPSVVLRSRPGVPTLLVWRTAGGGHRIVDPFSWPEVEGIREVSPRAVKTLAGASRAAGPAADSLRFLPSPGTESLCEAGPERWQCPGVPEPFEGVILVCGSGPRRFAAVRRADSGNVRLDGTGWSAWMSVDEASAAGPVGAPSRDASLTLEVPESDGQSFERTPLVPIRLGASSWFLHGEIFPGARIAVRQGRRAGSILLDDAAASACGEEIRLATTEARTVRGRVVDGAGRPLPRATILALEPRPEKGTGSAPPGPILLEQAIADEQGEWALADLDPRARIVRACHSRAGCAEEPIPPSGAAMELVVRPKWRFTGRVVSQSGVPQPDAHLRFLPTLDHFAGAADRLLVVPPEADAESDASGRFEISPPAPGNFLLEARSSLLGTARRDVAVTELSPAKTDLGDLVLKGAGEFFARVGGAGCAGGTLAFAGPMGVTSLPTMVDASIDGSGMARVALPEGGAWILLARCPDGRRLVTPGSFSNVEDLFGREVAVTIGPPSDDETEEEEEPRSP
ncbi:MAG: carboxypeptidase-like regulatory domain-containing protein [Acidobacteriota bacterium]